MAFDLKNFNEVNILGQAKDKLAKTVNKQKDRLSRIAQEKLETISTQAMRKQQWFGHSAEDFKQLYLEIYGLGQLLNANYFVEFEAYEDNATANLPLFADGLSGYLVSQTNLNLLQAEFEQVKVGTMQSNHFVGISEPDLQLSLIETADARFMNTIMDWRDLMVNPDGTANEPANYAMIITIGMFSRDFGLQYKPFSRRFIVGPSQSSKDDLTGQGTSEVAEVPFTLTVLRNFME